MPPLRARAESSRLGPVGASKLVHVALEVEQSEGTIRGEIAIDGSPARRFFGWLELMDRLGHVSGGHDRASAREPRAPVAGEQRTQPDTDTRGLL